MQLKDQAAIVTGAASLRGIGWATARRFADEGARVAILDLDPVAAEEAARAVGALHLGLACNVRDEAACRSAVQLVLDTFGRIDILVNNAGVSQSHRLMDSSQADYNLVMDASVRGAHNMSRAVVPHMRSRQQGAIVCMGSVAAQRGGGILGGPHYSAAKGGDTGAGQGDGTRTRARWHSGQRHRTGHGRHRPAGGQDRRCRQTARD